ncbi:MAG: hypothetical protein GWP18_01175, partial [Proteobacteria bacterium]|nr:hypothetical protein [Pseudomonadota bacterium]
MTVSPHLQSWVPVADGSDFPIQNLPYGVFADAEGERCGVAIGGVIVDLARAEAAGLFASTGLQHGTFRQNSLNTFLTHSRGVWSAVRARVTAMLTAGNEQGHTFATAHNVIIDHPVRLRLPVTIGELFVQPCSAPHLMISSRVICRPVCIFPAKVRIFDQNPKFFQKYVGQSQPHYFIPAITPLLWWGQRSMQCLWPHGAPYSATCCLSLRLWRISRKA